MPKYLVTYDNGNKDKNGEEYKGQKTEQTIREYLLSLNGMKVAETSYVVHSDLSTDGLYDFIFGEYKFDYANHEHHLAVAEVNYVKHMEDDRTIDPKKIAQMYMQKKARGE